jgi:hypothetical protein
MSPIGTGGQGGDLVFRVRIDTYYSVCCLSHVYVEVDSALHYYTTLNRDGRFSLSEASEGNHLL